MDKTVDLLSPEDLSAWLRVPVKTIYQWRSAGHGPQGMRVGRFVRYRRSAVEAWLAGREAADLTAPAGDAA